MSKRFVVRLMFGWGGGCLWCGNDATLAAFDVGPIEDKLPLSPAIQHRLTELSEWHDKALDWDYPPDPSPWSQEKRERFETAATDILSAVRSAVGPEFDVVYVPL